MRSHRSLFIAVLLAVGWVSQASASDIKIVANASVGASSASLQEIKAVFLLAKSALSDGSHVQPVIGKGPAYAEFCQEYLGKTPLGLETFYRSLVFSGTGAQPKTLNSDDEVLAYVAKTKGAVGYVSAGASTTGVKTLEVK